VNKKAFQHEGTLSITGAISPPAIYSDDSSDEMGDFWESGFLPLTPAEPQFSCSGFEANRNER